MNEPEHLLGELLVHVLGLCNLHKHALHTAYVRQAKRSLEPAATPAMNPRSMRRDDVISQSRHVTHAAQNTSSALQ